MNQFQPAGNLFLTQTHTSPVGVASGHLWYNSGTHFMGSSSAAQSGTTSCQYDQDYPTLGLTSGSLHILTTIQSAHSNRMGPALSSATQLHSRNELSGQLSERHAFNIDKSANNGMVLNRHRWDQHSQPTPCAYKILPSLHLDYIPWLFSTIANIANRAPYPPIPRR